VKRKELHLAICTFERKENFRWASSTCAFIERENLSPFLRISIHLIQILRSHLFPLK
jgi:hypothetical protein